jgi:hypothetical protein
VRHLASKSVRPTLLVIKASKDSVISFSSVGTASRLFGSIAIDTSTGDWSWSVVWPGILLVNKHSGAINLRDSVVYRPGVLLQM